MQVKPPLLFEDPVQTVLCLLYCRQVPTSCCSCELGAATRHLEKEALAKVLEVGERADLNVPMPSLDGGSHSLRADWLQRWSATNLRTSSYTRLGNGRV